MLIYRILSIILYPVIELYLFWRVIQKKEDKKRLRERFGKPTITRPQGQVIWLHAVSVGEANSSLILIDELLKFAPKTSILFTTTTLTSASVVEKKLPQFNGRVIHQFLPIDSYFCVLNFLNYWQPRAALFVESEIWPNLIYEARNRSCLPFLINARMSEKSFKKWQIASRFGFKIFDYFAAVFAQTLEDKERIEKISSQQVLFFGNLKAQAANLLVNEVELHKIKNAIGSRKFWIAASTHKGEEENILATHETLKKEFPDLLTIIVPRHPARADEIKNLFSGKQIAQRSKGEELTNSTEIYLCDTLGELGIIYSLGNFTFIGGSFLEIGGHNPFEAIKLNCAVISGKGVFNFKDIYRALEKESACVMVNDSNELTQAVRNFLNNENAAQSMNNKAVKVIGNSDNIAGKIVEKMDQILLIKV